MPSTPQLLRDCLCGTCICIFFSLFLFALQDYLSALSNPTLLIVAFGLSLFISSAFEIRHQRSREGFVAVMVNTILFTAGVLMAEYFRLYYLDLLSRVDSIHGARALIGDEYLSLASSKVVGYGASYGLALILTRIIARPTLLEYFSHKLILEPYRTDTCRHCQQDLRRNST